MYSLVACWASCVPILVCHIACRHEKKLDSEINGKVATHSFSDSVLGSGMGMPGAGTFTCAPVSIISIQLAIGMYVKRCPHPLVHQATPWISR